jgi:FMNH2-dependent dimethyl sulfone monooxygenase
MKSEDSLDFIDMKWGYWAPLGSGGFVISKLPQKTSFDFAANARYAQTAEKYGWDVALMPARYFVTHGWPEQYEAMTTTAALTQVTSRIRLIAALHPGLWHPGIVAKMGATVDQMSGGRWGLNVTTGFFKEEFIGFGEPWLDHDERYRRSEEFIRVMKGLWTEDALEFRGDFYRIHNAPLRPKPASQPTPPIFQGGNSQAAMHMAARVSDWLFIQGNTLEKAKEIVETAKGYARDEGREGALRCGINCFVICRETEAEARDLYEEICENADWEAIEHFMETVKQAGLASPERMGMWAESKGRDFVQQNDGFKPDLIGTPEQIAEKIQEFHAVGVDLILTGFFHYEEDLAAFGRDVIPMLKRMPSLRKQKAADVILAADERRKELGLGEATLPSELA